MAHGHETAHVACPTAIACGPENLFVGHFQVVFGIETHRCNGTMTRRAPEEEHVREFVGSHNNAPERQESESRTYHTFVYIITVKM